MKELDITVVYIPDVCTGYVQPIDTSLNNYKLVKDKIADILEETTPPDLENITVGQRRIAITHRRGLPDLTVGPCQIELESDEELEYFAELEGLPPGLQPGLQPEVLLQPSLQPELQPGICN